MSKARGLADLGNAFNDGALSNRNLIINGAMQVAQRGTSFPTATSNAYSLDRWVAEHSVPINIDQVAGYTEGGFAYSIKATAQSTVSLTSGQILIPFEQRLERALTDSVGFGTSGSKPLTLSFWIKSNRTGTCTVDLKINGQVGSNDAISQQYSVNSADTWEYKTITFPANTTTYSGISFNGSALTLFWWMAAGTAFTSGTIPSDWQAQTSANRAVGCTGSINTGDYWQITGVQLEVGDTATPFEHRSYGQELALCQRYFYRLPCDNAFSNAEVENTTGARGVIQFPTSMRTGPTMSYLSVGDFALRSGGAGYTLTSLTLGYTTTDNFRFNAGVASGLTAGRAGYLYGGIGDSIDFDAEL